MEQSHGRRFSTGTTETASPPPEIVNGVSQTSSVEDEPELGPSAFHETEEPYLSKFLDISTEIINELEVMPQVKVVDRFILDIIEERGWADTNESYQDVAEELFRNFNIHPNKEGLFKLETLVDGVEILIKQKQLEQQLSLIRKTP